MASEYQLQRILVLERNKARGAKLARALSRAFPSARVYCEADPACGASVLASGGIELLIACVHGFEFDVLTLLGVWTSNEAAGPRVLVLASEPSAATLTAVQSLPISGLLDLGRAKLKDIEAACRAIAAGSPYAVAPVSERNARTGQDPWTSSGADAAELPYTDDLRWHHRAPPLRRRSGTQHQRWRW
ncbi:hypothetical protein [Opitutus sp. ER46]|uniref:hypothetical protein n=1 Tax=Opitutus sp. ER46 TaxID=2161864 RepID=UPI0011B22BD8|nr:hypothetical protein [Opitutus sp. ER46]